jgi:hypothetical protein
MTKPFRVSPRSSYGKDFTSRPLSGTLAKRVYVCNGCGLWHITTKKPAQCMNKGCGRLDFEMFQSKDEATRWAQLLLLLKIGKITELRKQVRYDLLAYGPNGVPRKVAVYVADFVYRRDGVLVIEDVKPHGTDRFAAIKMQWMEAMGHKVTVIRIQR